MITINKENKKNRYYVFVIWDKDYKMWGNEIKVYADNLPKARQTIKREFPTKEYELVSINK